MFNKTYLSRFGGVFIVAASVMFWGTTATAIPVTWNLSGVTFDDGGTASGWFDYDADVNSVFDYDISVAGGDTGDFPEISYTDDNSSVGIYPRTGQEDVFIFQIDLSDRQFRITPVDELTNLGGTVAVDLFTAYNGSSGVECFNCNPWRRITAGELVASIPEPATLALFGIGFTARRRRKPA